MSNKLEQLEFEFVNILTPLRRQEKNPLESNSGRVPVLIAHNYSLKYKK